MSLTRLEMDQAKETQEGRRGAGPDGGGAAGFRVSLRKCLDYSIKNVGEGIPWWHSG